jgi:hypothetical protein
MLDPIALHTLHRATPIYADTLRAIVETLAPGTGRYRRHLILITFGTLLLVAALATALILLLYWKSDAAGRQDLVQMLRSGTLLPIIAPGLAISVVMPWMIVRHAQRSHVCAALLKHRRCPHCGYDLRGAPADGPPGTTICSECGCAWQTDDDRLQVAVSQDARLSRAGVALLVVGLVAALVLGVLFFVRM